MRWLVATLVVICVAVAVWLGSAIVTVGRIAQAVQAGDGAAVLARTDVAAVRRSLTGQIVRAYLDRAGETRKVSQIERMVANTYGATVTDALVAKFVTAENLTKLLKNGQFDGADNVPAISGFPTLGPLKSGDVLDVVRRISFIQPVLLSVRLSPTAQPDLAAAIVLHLDGSGWRLAGFDLPKAVIRQLAASIPLK